MKKASLFAGAAVAAAIGFAAMPAMAQGPFADVPADHWAYEAVQKLATEGIVIGYPDNTYGGKRAMTRYEFAVAIARLLEKIPEGVGPGNPPAVDTSNLATKAEVEELRNRLNQLNPDQINELRRLVDEFRTELTTLGVDLDGVKRRLDGLERRVDMLENELKRVRIGGNVNVMVRGNNRRGDSGQPFIDQNGFQLKSGPSSGRILNDTYVLHDLDLNIKARLSDTANAEAILNFGNYLPYLNGIASLQGSRSTNVGTGVPNQSQSQTVYKLAVEAPVKLFGGIGVDFSVGRVPTQLTPYTFKLIDADAYFANDKTDLGDIPIDGGVAVTKLGPLGVTLMAGKVNPIQFVSDIYGQFDSTQVGYGLYAGASSVPLPGGFRPGNRPTGMLIQPGNNGAMAVEQLAAARVTFGAGAFGTIGGTFLAAGGANDLTQANGFDRVYVYGADLNTSFSGIGIKASYTKSDTLAPSSINGAGQPTSTGRDNVIKNDNEAWDVALNYSLGSLTLGGGYRDIGPYFAAPGYWGRVGSWTNPTDIKGFYAKANYGLGSGMSVYGEGQFYKGADKVAGGLTTDDKVNNFRAGLKYGLTSSSNVDLGVEWTEYDSNNLTGKPREIFYNIGYGYSFNPNTSFKLLYQIVNYDDKGTGFDVVNKDGGVAAAQFQVKF